MRLGIFTVPYRERPLETLLPELAALGIEAIELGTGNYPGDDHCPLDTLLDDPRAQAALLELVEDNGMTISALSQQGNPLHPRREVASSAHEIWRKTVRLASQLGVPVVNAFSGCPGDSGGSVHPNWVICAWPPEFLDLLAWQWNEIVSPYWVEEARFAASLGIDVAIEMHPGFVVYNPTTMLELRARAGENIGRRTSTQAISSGRESTPSRRSRCSQKKAPSTTSTQRTPSYAKQRSGERASLTSPRPNTSTSGRGRSARSA